MVYEAVSILDDTQRTVDRYAEQGYDPLLWLIVSTQVERVRERLSNAMKEE